MVVAGLDYRKLTDESLDPLAALQPVLTSQNVLSISKLAHRLPVPGGGDATVSASAVHTTWLQKLFWKGDPQLLKRPPQGDPDYMHAYDTCAKYLDRLAPADAVRFLDDITFSPDAAKHVSLVLSSPYSRMIAIYESKKVYMKEEKGYNLINMFLLCRSTPLSFYFISFTHFSL